MISPTSARANLRRIEPDRARTQSALIGAFNNRHVAELRLSARIAHERDRHAADRWIGFETRAGAVAVAPLLVDGTLARMTVRGGEPDGVAAATTLGRIEPLVAAAETVLGAELHPDALLASAADDAVTVCLDAHDARGLIVHRVLLAVPSGATIRPLDAPALLPSIGMRLRLRWSARIALPAVRAARLATLARGDLILAGIGAPVAQLSLPARRGEWRATLDWRARSFVLERHPQQGDTSVISGLDEHIPQPAAGGDAAAADWGDLRIPLAMEFDGGGMTAADLAALGQGSVLPLPSHGGTLAVRVVAGEQIIADGELVALGEGFGVLITGLRAPVAA
ncbi:FliM/FliN family flagellar motor switch protein [Sphingomonas sp. RB3P16]|uniref:FliM/FliN family flagellar motor switch protein n=1 Tax=Parasphingomonas frigoris TaxID=3096163 RepID=UPI002FCC6F44